MSTPSRKTYLFVNGNLPESARLRATITAGDRLIAVDGGLRHIVSLGLTPDLIIGDLDSADPDLVRQCRSQGVEVRQFPAEKDETDLELALQVALAWESPTIRIVAALGDRLDQTLGNIFLLTQPRLTGVDIRLVDGEQAVWLIRRSTEIHGVPGERVSLLPLLGPAKGIVTTGLAYPLRSETLFPDQTRGISNRLIAETATVTLQSGQLLIIHTIGTHSDERISSNDETAN